MALATAQLTAKALDALALHKTRPFRVSMSSICIPPEAADLLNECLHNEAIGQSYYIEAFEQAVADFAGMKYAIAVSSGTLADAVACAAMKYGRGITRVIVPALTFVAQPNAVRLAGLEIQFSDVREDWTLDRREWMSEPNVLPFPTHLMGRAAEVGNMPSPFIEDACESLGSLWQGKKLGTFGEMGTFSFFVSHTIALGEGGAIVTNDRDLAQLCRQLRSHGRASEKDAMRKFSFPYLGFNAKMSGLVAAFGLGVFGHVQEYLARRRENYLRLNARLANRYPERPGETIIPHAYPLAFESETARNTAMQNLLAVGVECRKFFSSVPTEAAYQSREGDCIKQSWGKFPVAENIARTYLLVPCHQNLSDDDVNWLAGRVLEQKGLCSPSSC